MLNQKIVLKMKYSAFKHHFGGSAEFRVYERNRPPALKPTEKF